MVTGTTMPSTIFSTAMMMVFSITLVKFAILNSVLKFFMPTHFEPKKPLAGRYFMKATRIPAMGI